MIKTIYAYLNPNTYEIDGYVFEDTCVENNTKFSMGLITRPEYTSKDLDEILELIVELTSIPLKVEDFKIPTISELKNRSIIRTHHEFMD